MKDQSMKKTLLFALALAGLVSTSRAGVTGYATGMLMIWFMNTLDYPLVVGGKVIGSVLVNHGAPLSER